MIIVDLVFRLSLLVAISILSGFIVVRFERIKLSGKILQGLLFGMAAVIGMHDPFILSKGIIFDGRSILISLCTLFFGPLSGIIAAVMALIYRLIIGGAGLIMGSSVIMSSFVIGYIFHIRRASRPDLKLSAFKLYQFGLLVHAAMLLLILTIPLANILNVYKSISLTVIGIYPFVTLLIGKILLDQEENQSFIKKLEESEERIRLSLKSANQGFYDLNVQTGNAVVSEEYATMLGYDPKTFVETNSFLIERLHPDDKLAATKAYLDYVEGRTQEYRIEFRQRTRDGRWKWILSTGKIVEHDFEGKPLRMLGTHTDITEMKQTVLALQKSEEKFVKMFRSSPDAIILTSLLDGLIFDVNEAATQLTGFEKWELVGSKTTLMNIWVNIKDRDFYIEQLKKTGKVSNLESQFRIKTGEIKYALISGEIIELDNQKFILGVIRDITERKNTEKVLFENQMRLQSIVDNAPVVLYGFDADGVFTFSEGKGLEKLGLKPGEVVGQSVFEFYRDFPTMLDFIKRALRGEVTSATHVLGNLSFDVHYTQLKDENGQINGMIGVATDITERKLAEEEIRIKNRDLAKMFEISLGLLESLDKKSTLKTIVESASELLELDTGAIYLIDNDDLYLEVTTPPLPDNYPNELRKAKLFNHSHISKLVATGLPVAMPDSAAAELTAEERLIIEARNLQSILYLPLLVEMKVIGVIILGTVGRKHNFTQREIDLSKTLSNLASLALENTVLFEKLNNHVIELGIAVSEKNVALDALKESEERFHAMFEKHNAVMLLIKPDSGIIIDANQSAEKFYGYNLSQLRQMNISQINMLPPDQLHQEIQKAASESRTYFNFSHKLRSGEIRSVEVFSTPIAVKNETLLFSIIHDITEKKLVEEEVIKSQNQLRALADKLEKIREEERINLSRELHDNLGQSLTGLKMDVAWLGRKISKKKPETVEAILDKTKSMSELIDVVINDVRRIALDLRPNLLDHLGLLSALNFLVDDFKKRTEKKCEFISNVKDIKVNQTTATAVFRIFQEAFTNVVRHSGSTQIQFYVDTSNTDYIFTLKDNGKGISEDEIKSVSSLGVRGMKERSVQINATLTINGTKNKGTTITLTVPKDKI